VYSASVGGGWRSPVEVIDKARAAAERALELDESVAEAHRALGSLKLVFDWDFEGAAPELRRAIDLDPGLADARISYVQLLERLGGRTRSDKALEQLKAAIQADPLSPWVRAQSAWTYFVLHDTARVHEETRRLLDLGPGTEWEAIALFWEALMDPTVEGYVTKLERGVEVTERKYADALMWLGSAYQRTDRHEDAVAIMNELRELAKTRYVSPVLFARMYAAMGDIDAAFEELERAYELRCGYLFNMYVLKGRLGSDPRYDDLVKRIGLPDPEPRS